MRTIKMSCPTCGKTFTKVLTGKKVKNRCCSKDSILVHQPKEILYELNLETMEVISSNRKFEFKPKLKEGFIYQYANNIEEAQIKLKARINSNPELMKKFLIKNNIVSLPEKDSPILEKVQQKKIESCNISKPI